MPTLLELATAAAIAAAGTTPSDGAVAAGREEYMSSCAVCHGADLRGEGPYAMFLRTKPTDLTRLAAGNDGEFPFERLYKVIDGRVEVLLHGPREMPVWGFEYNEEAKRRYQGIVGRDAVENFVSRRILSLIRYIESEQRP
jgi:mono/diheme cytochrome c family protein